MPANESAIAHGQRLVLSIFIRKCGRSSRRMRQRQQNKHPLNLSKNWENVQLLMGKHPDLGL